MNVLSVVPTNPFSQKIQPRKKRMRHNRIFIFAGMVILLLFFFTATSVFAGTVNSSPQAIQAFRKQCAQCGGIPEQIFFDNEIANRKLSCGIAQVGIGPGQKISPLYTTNGSETFPFAYVNVNESTLAGDVLICCIPSLPIGKTIECKYGASKLIVPSASAILSESIIPDFVFQIPIPKSPQSFKVCERTAGGKLECSGIAKYVTYIYRWLIGFAAILAAVALTWGGVLWLISRGESGKIQESKKIITNALVGLLLALGSYGFLFTLGKDYTTYKPITIRTIQSVGLEFDPPAPDDPTVPGGGGSIGVSRDGTPGRKCSGDEPTALWKKVYSVPKENELNNYIQAEYSRRTGLPHEKALIGKAGIIIREAQKNGIDVGLALGVWMRESQWWGLHRYDGNYNFGDVTAKSCDSTIQCSIDYNPAACKNGACKAGGAGGVMKDRCMRCFNSIDEGIAGWMAYASRYSASATIAEAIERYAPRYENEATCNGSYIDMITGFIVDMAKISTGGDVSDRVKKELGCGSDRTKPYIPRTYDTSGPKGHKCKPE